MGNLFFNSGRFNDALDNFKKALSLAPDNAAIRNNIGSIFLKQGKWEEAEMHLLNALSENPQNIPTLINLGIVSRALRKFSTSLEFLELARSIEPKNHTIHFNIGLTHTSLDNMDRAIEAYRTALELNPNYEGAHNNLGSLLQKQGDIEGALTSYNNSITSGGSDAGACINMFSLCSQLQHVRIPRITAVFDTLKKNNLMDLNPRLIILNAIDAFLERDFTVVKNNLKLFDQLNREMIEKLSVKDKVFCVAYRNFMHELIEYSIIADTQSGTAPKIYHLGESHCLSYAHKHVLIDGQMHLISPLITLGAKAFHFASTGDNEYKAITRLKIQTLPKESKFFISFGEIDCRIEEGFSVAARKLKKPIDVVISQTVERYMNWFVSRLDFEPENVYFFNVPAPMFDEKYQQRQNDMRANTVSIFNSLLSNHIHLNNFNLVDVFSFSLGENGFSNGLFHIDNNHLGPLALGEIEKQL